MPFSAIVELDVIAATVIRRNRGNEMESEATNAYEWCVLAVQLITLLAVSATAYIYYRQLRVMSAQLIAMQNSAQAQNSLRIVELLQAENVRASRRVVRESLHGKEVSTWTEEECSHASTVAANYDVAAALLKTGLGSKELIATDWGTSIRHCYETLKPFIDKQRNREGGDAKYWRNFEWLYAYAEELRHPPAGADR